MAEFKEERKAIVRALKEVNFDRKLIDQSAFELRGFEAYLSVDINKLVQQKRSEVTNTVLDVQAFQRFQGSFDCESLRVACSKASKWARQRALHQGELDSIGAGTSKATPCSHYTIN